MSIKQWPLTERPREKLLDGGVHTLSDAELLAIFLCTGTRGKTAVDLARELLMQKGSLRKLLETPYREFCEFNGMGPAKYALLQAALEMGHRHLQETLVRENVLTNSIGTGQYLTARLRRFEHEVFAGLFLDNQHRLISFDELFHGSIDTAPVYPREVVKRALEHNAAAVIFAHNHPSGLAVPSLADQKVTRQLMQALELVQVKVLDHFIIGEKQAVSMAELGLLG